MEWEKHPDGTLTSGEFVVGPQPHDDVLAYTYLTFKRTGILETVWYQDPPSIQEFLKDLTVPGSTIGCWRRRGDRAEFLGMGLVNATQRMGDLVKCEVGFCFLPELTTIHEKVALGRGMLQYIFDVMGVASVFGTTPSANKAALAYSRRLGFTLHGPIADFCMYQGVLSSVYISQISKP